MKIKFNQDILKWLYRFVDFEAGSASMSSRIIEYTFAIKKFLPLNPGTVLDCGCTTKHNILSLLLTNLGWNVYSPKFI